MTVLELIDLLGKLPGEAEVIIAKDAEGNSFSDPAEVEADYLVYEDEVGRYDGIYTRTDLYLDGDDDDFIDEHYREVCVLWPV